MGCALVIMIMYLSNLILLSVLYPLTLCKSRDWLRVEHIPNFSLMIPRMPAMLDTRFVPSIDPSFNRISPVGLEITSVGDVGEEGDVNA